MNALPETFPYDGFLCRQLQREGDAVLLEKSKASHPEPTYEVIIVQRHPAQNIRGREYPERESMPPSESWGALGWSYSDLRAAKSKFDHLITSFANAHSAPAPFPTGALQSKESNNRT